MTHKKILVTGGLGFIGSNLVRALVGNGHHVRVFDDSSRGSITRIQDILDSIEFVQGDIRDAPAVHDACKGMDMVCHLAYINGTEFFYSKPELVLEVGVKGMVNVLDGCIKHAVKEFLLTSSSEVYQTPPKIPTDETAPLIVPDPHNPRYSYGGGKIISELLAINYGRKYFERCFIVRPHNVYGPNMGYEHVIPQFISQMKQLCNKNSKNTLDVLDFKIQGDGTETRAFIYIDDFINGLLCVIQNGKHLGIYHIGTMDEISIGDVARMVALSFNKKIRLVPTPLQKGSTPRRCPDIEKLKSLGFAPCVPLEVGIKKTVLWYQKYAQSKI